MYTIMENMEMKDRIAHIIRAKNLTAAEFALRLGIQPSNVSHLLSGRNNPSLEFVKKLKETFPEYNLDWIVMGSGPMTVSEPFATPAPVLEKSELVDIPEIDDDLASTLFAQQESAMLPLDAPLSRPSALKKIILVYDDRTFEEILPR